MELKHIAVYTSKDVLTPHGICQQNKVMLRRNLRRDKFEASLAGQPPTMVVLEARGRSHQGGRQLTGLRHHVRSIPPQRIKSFVKTGKDDRNDAEAISRSYSAC